jgi:hypothetical protein
MGPWVDSNLSGRNFAARGLFVVTILSSANASSEFSYDRQLAIELAISYTKSEFRRSPKIALPGVDYKHPNTLTIIDKSKRRLVFVSFSSAKPSESSSGVWGVVAVFQLCKESKTLRMIDLYTVDPIESERSADAQGDGAVFVHLPDVCPSLGE